MIYIQETKDYMLMYRWTDNLEVIDYSDVDFVNCVDSQISASNYNFNLSCWPPERCKEIYKIPLGIKDYILMYRRTNLEAIDYSDTDFVGCFDSRNSTSSYFSW